MEKSDDFLFPFSTCEKPYKHSLWIAQPWSVAANIVNCMILGYFLLKTKKKYAFLFLLFLFLFEIVHTFSHAVHLSGSIQVNFVHFFGYFATFFLFLSFYTYVHSSLHIVFLFYLLCVFIFDLYAFFNLSFIYFFTASVVNFLSIFFYFYPYLSQVQQKMMKYIIAITMVIFALVLNEKINSKRMLQWWPTFPFHILVEIMGWGIFYLLGTFFSAL